ncbi:hypothetical protein FXW78_25845 [Rhodococcus opacus]|nr:hypothetical protein [Rhodococcus opacus]
MNLNAHPHDPSPLGLVHDTYGNPVAPTGVCDELTSDAVSVPRGPGGRAAPGTAVIAEVLAQHRRGERRVAGFRTPAASLRA